MAMTRAAPQPFTDKQIELVTTFADQAVIAIENARLFEEVQARTARAAESLEYQTATSDVLNVISRSPSEISPSSTRSSRRRAGFARRMTPCISLREGELLKVAAHHGPIPVDFDKLAHRTRLD